MAAPFFRIWTADVELFVFFHLFRLYFGSISFTISMSSLQSSVSLCSLVDSTFMFRPYWNSSRNSMIVVSCFSSSFSYSLSALMNLLSSVIFSCSMRVSIAASVHSWFRDSYPCFASNASMQWYKQ